MFLGKKEVPGATTGILDLEKIVEVYEDEMIQRVEPAIKRASLACIDANHFDRVKEGSFFTSPRAITNTTR